MNAWLKSPSSSKSRSNSHVGARFALAVDGVDDEGSLLEAAHARRAGRHAGQREAFDRRLLGQQLLHRFDRHMAVDDVIADKGRVAAFQLGGNSRLGAERRNILTLLD